MPHLTSGNGLFMMRFHPLARPLGANAYMSKFVGPIIIPSNFVLPHGALHAFGVHLAHGSWTRSGLQSGTGVIY